jgi:hypothetical protein
MTQNVQASLMDRAPPGALWNANREARGPIFKRLIEIGI